MIFISFPYLAFSLLNPGNRIAIDMGIIRTPLVTPVNSKAFAEISIYSNKIKKSAVPKTNGETQIIRKEPTSNNILNNFCFWSTISKQRHKETIKFIRVANEATKSEFIAGKIKLSEGMVIFANPLTVITRMGKKMNTQKILMKK